MSGTVEIDWRSMFKGVLSRMREAGESNEMGARWMAHEADSAVYAALAAKDAEIARLEDELYDAQHGPWPEWAEKILKVVRSYSGYDGYDDVTDGIDLVGEVEEALSEFYTEAERLRAKLKEVTDAAL